ncbi:hypothetical protein AA313_de0205813 [Arthrobotrys entomopaga]|nr:hypothetical protein AA313_de0205813 [Arthrobotrys entomopaga]
MSQSKKGPTLHAKASQVFADFWDIFHDKYCIRKIKDIKAILEMDQNRRFFQTACLRLAMSPEDLISVIQDLILRGAFDPDLKVARECFPDLVIAAQPEPQQSQQSPQSMQTKQKPAPKQVGNVFGTVQQRDSRQNFNPSSSQESTASQGASKKRKTTTEWDFPASISSWPSSTDNEMKKPKLHPQPGPTSSQETPVNLKAEFSVEQVVATKVPNLLPVHLPSHIQHALLTEAKAILEEGCYFFVKKWMPEKTEFPPFNHPRAAHLHEWLRLIDREWNKYPEEAIDQAAFLMGPPPNRITATLEKLRDCVVQRINLESKFLEMMVGAGATYMEILKDDIRKQKLKKIAQILTGLSEPLESRTILLMDEWKKELTDIEQNKRDLKEKEINVMKKFWDEHKRMKDSICFDMKELRESLDVMKDRIRVIGKGTFFGPEDDMAGVGAQEKRRSLG